MIKQRNITKQADELATQLADKPYQNNPDMEQLSASENKLIRTSVSLPKSMQQALEDLAIKNKREGKELRTISAIIRTAVDSYFTSNNY